MIRNLILTTSIAAIASMTACAQPAESADTASKAEIEGIVRAYILENPEIIEEALIALNAKREQQQADAAIAAIKSNSEAIYRASTDYSIGPEDAPVTVVEFFDYRCPHCRPAADLMQVLPERYNGKVRVVFKEFPVLSQESVEASKAALAAGRQGKYIEMHQALMKSPSRFTDADLTKIAGNVGLDIDQWQEDRKDKAINDQIDATYQLASLIGANSTPTFIVNDELFSGLGPIERSKMESLITEGIAAAE